MDEPVADWHLAVDLIVAKAIDLEQLKNDVTELAVRYGVDIDDIRAALDPWTV